MRNNPKTKIEIYRIDVALSKAFLVLDNLRVHHSKPVKAWALENANKIELFYFPSYSPELNPEERLTNGDAELYAASQRQNRANMIKGGLPLIGAVAVGVAGNAVYELIVKRLLA